MKPVIHPVHPLSGTMDMRQAGYQTNWASVCAWTAAGEITFDGCQEEQLQPDEKGEFDHGPSLTTTIPGCALRRCALPVNVQLVKPWPFPATAYGCSNDSHENMLLEMEADNGTITSDDA